MTQGRSERSNVHGQGRRLLLAAARELFAEKGFGGTSTREVAERAGVSEPMLFRHFGNKANLFQEAAVTPFVDFMNDYIEDYRGREHGKLSAEQEGAQFFDGVFRALRDRRELLMALMSAHQFDQVVDDVSVQVRGAFSQVLQLFEEVVTSESRARGFFDFDPAASVRVMLGMVLSVALHGEWMLIGDAVSYERVMAAMTTMAVRGLGVPDRSEPE
jgi:AcrR family transcriptional regulator